MYVCMSRTAVHLRCNRSLRHAVRALSLCSCSLGASAPPYIYMTFNSSLSVTVRLRCRGKCMLTISIRQTYLRSLWVNKENMPWIPSTNKHPRTIRLYTSVPHWSTILSADPLFQCHRFSSKIILNEIKGCLFRLKAATDNNF